MQNEIDSVKSDAAERVEQVNQQLEVERFRSKDEFDRMKSKFVRDAENLKLELAETKRLSDERVNAIDREMKQCTLRLSSENDTQYQDQ